MRPRDSHNCTPKKVRYAPPPYLIKTKMPGYAATVAATPNTAAAATKPTPTSSPDIIHKVLRTPMVMPMVNAKVMHSPGVIDTKKNVGTKMESSAKSTMTA